MILHIQTLAFQAAAKRQLLLPLKNIRPSLLPSFPKIPLLVPVPIPTKEWIRQPKNTTTKRPNPLKMEANLFTLPSSSPTPQSSPSISLKAHFRNPLITSTYLRHRRPKTAPLTIRAAISRAKKEETVETVKQQLLECYLIAGIGYKGFTVKQFQELREQFPDSAKLLVAKNRLVYKAIEGTPWEALKPCMKGMNAWLFVHSEEIPAALKPFREFQKEKKLESNDFVGAVFEGKYYGPDDFKTLESLPSRAEVYAKILGSLKRPASAVVGTLQAPARNLIMVLQAHVKKLEEGGSAGD